MDKEVEDRQDTLESIRPYIPVNDLVDIRKNNYQLRFNEKTTIEDYFFLSEATCKLELKKAEAMLSDKYKYVDAKIIPYDEYPNIKGVIEIIVDGRRFSIPRDGVTDYGYSGNSLSVSMSNSVISVLEKEKWPKKYSFTMTQEIEAALDDIAGTSLVDNAMDLAKYLQLGDKYKVNKKKELNREVIDDALKKFGVDDIDELKKILKSIGLKIIAIPDRLSDINNSQTEIDALVESIEKYYQ